MRLAGKFISRVRQWRRAVRIKKVDNMSIYEAFEAERTGKPDAFSKFDQFIENLYKGFYPYLEESEGKGVVEEEYERIEKIRQQQPEVINEEDSNLLSDLYDIPKEDWDELNEIAVPAEMSDSEYFRNKILGKDNGKPNGEVRIIV